MNENWDPRLVDPLVIQAEKILGQRQARNLVIDPDLLGEPGWDILLSAFIAGGRGTACSVDRLAVDLNLPLRSAERWAALLVDRGMLDAKGNLVVLTESAEKTMRTMFKGQLLEALREFNAFAAGDRAKTG